ncbi:uncharacterized protein [Primulina eburnea]|uniref:uncharacterized protein n=1 Tax=Primulina eburnea TaxID=1245227 RepID=UPI003C6BFC55
MGADVLVNIEDLRSCSVKSICRICHDEESESCKSLEAPCACTGTVKFAHRDCIQRWCNEKGNAICEICLQKFEPGYTSQPKKAHLIDTTTVTIRGSLEIPRINPEQNVGEILETEYSECASAADRSAACCRSVALILTALLLIRHLFDVFNSGAGSGSYPLSLPTLLIVKASGILLPMYVILRVIAAIHNSIRHHHQQRSITNMLSSDDEDDEGQDNSVVSQP